MSRTGAATSSVPPIPMEGEVADHLYLFMKVEKRGTYRTSWTARDFAVDLKRRHVYMSGKESSFNTPWKHKAKLYGITAAAILQDLPFRSPGLDPHELLGFTIEGADRELAKQDPIFTHGSTALAVYEEGTLQPTVAKSPRVRRKNGVIPAEGDDFETNRVTWELRCRSYEEFARVFFPLRELLEVDGYRSPLRAGLPPVDPRNALPFVSLPLHLWRPFKSIARSVMYTCIHVNLVGCDHSGKVGMCTPHTYLCMTDEGVLFLDEKGRACRWVSARYISGVYYNVTSGTPFLAILAEGRKADTLCYLTPAFAPAAAEGGGKAVAPVKKNITDAVPTQSPASAVADVVNVIKTLKSQIDPAEAQEGGNELYVEELTHEELGVDAFVRDFEGVYSRLFKWQTLPGDDDSGPRLRSMVGIAKQLKLLPPKRSGVTLREVLIPFYTQFVEHDVHSASEGANAEKADTEGEEFAVHMPVKRTSKILDFFIPLTIA